MERLVQVYQADMLWCVATQLGSLGGKKPDLPRYGDMLSKLDHPAADKSGAEIVDGLKKELRMRMARRELKNLP